MKTRDYWTECIMEACEDAGLKATSDQVDVIASWVEGAHENYGMAHGHDCITSPAAQENERLKRELRDERNKITCSECRGRGYIVEHGLSHSAEFECSKCRGEGRL